MPIKGVRRFGVIGKLSPRYIRPFEILRRIGTLAYELALPPQLSRNHISIMLLISIFRKYVPDPQHVIDFQTLQIRENVSYEEMPISILE